MVEVIGGMTRKMFVKSMTTFADHRVWQDVYHVPARDLLLYVKIPGRCRDRVHSHGIQGEMTMARETSETMISPETGDILTRGVRPFTVTYKGESMVVDLPGYYPASASDGDGMHVGEDMAAVDAALRILKEKIDGVPAPETIRRMRTKLKLSQREAGSLFKVGENAFDKYERGLIEPSGPTIQLMTLLEKHPELLDELR
nr:type II toxin-antitoxin system MqsR family toxin [Mesorhizobium sp. B4-1-3]